MKSIRKKILLIIGGLMIAVMVVSGVFVTQYTGKIVREDAGNIATLSTEKIVANVNTYFERYVAIARQMAKDEGVVNLIASGATSYNLLQSPYYEDVHTMLDSTLSADAENILTAYVVSAGTDLGFNSEDWISDPETYHLSEKAYNFRDADSLKKDVIITEAYEDLLTGNMVVTISAPVYSKSGAYIGIAALDVQITSVNEMVTNAKSTYRTGYQALISGSNTVLAFPDGDKVLKSVDEIGFSSEMTDVIKDSRSKVVEFDDNGVSSYGVLGVADYTGWKVLSVIPREEYLASAATTARTINILYFVCVVLLLVVIFTVSGGIVAPLRKLTQVTDELVKGNLKAEIDVKSRDEVGQLANSMRDLTGRLSTYIDYIEEVSGALEQFGKGNLNIELKHDYDGEFARLKKSMLATASVFKQTIGEMMEIANQVSSSSGQVASGAQILAQGATEQASSIQELSATIQEISSNVNRNAEHAKNAASQVGIVGDTAQKSNQQMKRMLEAIAQINEKSSEIGKIIKTIDDIAFQTNILALNAAVEAARAGEAGKGFAVVADEVRSLAGKSAEAAKDTTQLIEDSIRAVENGTAIADETEKMLEEVLSGVTETVTAINEISDASADQAGTISQILLGVEQISAVVQTNSATAEESSAASEELASQAELLQKVSGRFRV